jgi:L-iditol 2-dehydrogenase
MFQETMMALVKKAKGIDNLELLQVPVPQIGDNEALIEIKSCGICGTDIHIKHDEFPYWPPVILGHEFSGVVAAVGKNVTDVKVGDRVVGEPHTKACGKCELCRTGNVQICASKRSPGWGIDGGFAKYMSMPDTHLLHCIPDDMSFEEAAVIEPTVNVVQDAIMRPGVEPNDTVVVFGPGPIGLLSIMALKASGAGKIIVVGTTADLAIRLPVAEKIGVDAIILADQQDTISEVMRLTNNRGADLIVEASGAVAAVRDSVFCVRRMGRITQIGLTGKEMVQFPWDKASWKLVTVFFNLSTAYSGWDRSIGLVASKKIDVNKIISHVRPLSEWHQAFDDIESMKALKVILVP